MYGRRGGERRPDDGRLFINKGRTGKQPDLDGPLRVGPRTAEWIMRQIDRGADYAELRIAAWENEDGSLTVKIDDPTYKERQDRRPPDDRGSRREGRRFSDRSGNYDDRDRGRDRGYDDRGDPRDDDRRPLRDDLDDDIPF